MLVFNIATDDNYYDPTYPSYVIGFYSSDETKVWVTTLSGHERRELLAKIKKLRNDAMELSGKLAAQEERFKDIKVILDTTFAVLLLAGAGMIGFFIDMLF